MFDRFEIRIQPKHDTRHLPDGFLPWSCNSDDQRLHLQPSSSNQMNMMERDGKAVHHILMSTAVQVDGTVPWETWKRATT
jgi:hypothetical protein